MEVKIKKTPCSEDYQLPVITSSVPAAYIHSCCSFCFFSISLLVLPRNRAITMFVVDEILVCYGQRNWNKCCFGLILFSFDFHSCLCSSKEFIVSSE